MSKPEGISVIIYTDWSVSTDFSFGIDEPNGKAFTYDLLTARIAAEKAEARREALEEVIDAIPDKLFVFIDSDGDKVFKSTKEIKNNIRALLDKKEPT